MRWTDRGIVLGARRFGENGAIAELFTAEHGRHAGLLPAGQSRRLRAALQPGTLVAASWTARLEDQLGIFTLEPISAPVTRVLDDAAALDAVGSMVALLRTFAERDAHPRLHAATEQLLATLATPGWPETYARWEMALLEEAGFGLDASACAVTNSADVVFISPKTGRGVSAEAAGAYATRLFTLPTLLGGTAGMTETLAMLAHFIERELCAGVLPVARVRLARRLASRS